MIDWIVVPLSQWGCLFAAIWVFGKIRKQIETQKLAREAVALRIAREK
jgi:hypothetical protein